MSTLPHEILETHADISALVIWLHGLGANGHDFVPMVPELNLPKNLGIRFVFPHAPSIPVTINGGMVMPAWYDIYAMQLERAIDEKQIMASAAAVVALIENEIDKGISSERVVIAGFSQGGAVAYQAALAYDKPLGGVLALSTYFATHKTIEPHPANKNIPIGIFHGSTDNVVPEILGQQAVKTLKDMGYSPTYATYPMAHSVHPQEIMDISAWLQTQLSAH